jgi:Glycosyl transferases group 1
MACGTPVVAFRRGSVPEVMTDGVTGFVVDDVGGAVEAVRATAALDRAACRRAFVERFSVARMARDYLAVYRRLVAGEAWPPVESWGRSAPRAPCEAIHHQHGLLGPIGYAAAPSRH